MAMRAGDWVEVRSKAEILGSLDRQGRLEGLPFMPQMFEYCGRRFRVYKRAHKTCDTVTGTGGRWVADAIHLDLRCDGKAHGGCEAACLLFWKEAWLKPVAGETEDSPAAVGSRSRGDGEAARTASCTEADVWKATCVEGTPGQKGARYVCQATLLPEYTTLLPWWDVRQFVEDYTSGNASLGRIFRGFVYFAYYRLTLAWLERQGRPARWLYDRFQAAIGGIPFPRRKGVIPRADLTPTATPLDLQPGELVRVKSYEEILATLDTTNKNRGLYFDAEMVPFCGGTYRVRSRVNKFLDETTGKMKSLKTPAVILDKAWCQSRYSDCRLFCPRSIFPWWREIWLERVLENARPSENVRRAKVEA